MNSAFNRHLFYGLRPRVKPVCGTCKHRKPGLTTICHKYKKLPPDVQHGRYCGKYEGEGR